MQKIEIYKILHPLERKEKQKRKKEKNLICFSKITVSNLFYFINEIDSSQKSSWPILNFSSSYCKLGFSSLTKQSINGRELLRQNCSGSKPIILAASYTGHFFTSMLTLSALSFRISPMKLLIMIQNKPETETYALGHGAEALSSWINPMKLLIMTKNNLQLKKMFCNFSSL